LRWRVSGWVGAGVACLHGQKSAHRLPLARPREARTEFVDAFLMG
jgi:hypothetical protein